MPSIARKVEALHPRVHSTFEKSPARRSSPRPRTGVAPVARRLDHETDQGRFVFLDTQTEIAGHVAKWSYYIPARTHTP